MCGTDFSEQLNVFYLQFSLPSRVCRCAEWVHGSVRAPVCSRWSRSASVRKHCKTAVLSVQTEIWL